MSTLTGSSSDTQRHSRSVWEHEKPSVGTATKGNLTPVGSLEAKQDTVCVCQEEQVEQKN